MNDNRNDNRTPYDLSIENARYEETENVREVKAFVLENLRGLESRGYKGCQWSQHLVNMYLKFLRAQTNQDKAQTATNLLLAYDIYVMRVIGS